ncbi:MAG: MYXO-CTERM sorting domain-containing protein [Myxococcaceae bacterium]
MTRVLPALLCLAVACAPPSAPKPLETKTVKSALEVPEGYRPTPFGWMHESCVHAQPSGSKVDFKHVVPCAYPKVVVNPKPPGDGHPPAANGWQIDTQAMVGTPMIHMTSIMQVPANPSTNSGQLDYFFPGASPTNADSILQPVLQYGVSPIGGGTKWGIGSWSCDVVTSAGCHGSDLKDVASGDVILGTIDGTNCDTGGHCDWAITTTDLTNGETTTLNTTGDIHAYPWLFSGVLEAYSVTKCTDYPANGTEAFSNVIFTDAQNNRINAGWTLDVGQTNAANCPVMDATFTDTTALLKFTDKTLPTVALTPGDGPVSQAMVTLSANATAGSGSALSGLTLSQNGMQVAAATGGASTVGYTWNTGALANGAYTFAATATDADGASSTAYSTLSVLNPPTVTITAGNGGTVSGVVQVQASATPPNGTTVTKVELKSAGTVVATGATSASYMLDTTTLSNGPGASLVATATDADGSNGSATLQLTIANPPVVVLTATPNSNGNVAFQANTTPAMGAQLATIEIQVDGSRVGVPGSSTTFGATWDSSAVANGSSHTAIAIATQVDGAVGQSAPQTFVVKNAPKVTVTSAPTGEAGKPYVASATATAPNGTTLTQLVLQIDGEQAAMGTTGELSYSWKTDDKLIGTHTVTAIATSADGTVGSGSLMFTITKAKGCGCDAGGAAPLMVLAALALLRRRR